MRRAEYIKMRKGWIGNRTGRKEKGVKKTENENEELR
jgi:hypothetical protein